MAITALSVSLDRDSYSRFETDRGYHLINARITPTPTTPDSGETVTVTLRRQGSANRILATQTIVYDGAVHARGDLAQFDLTAVVDSGGLPLVIQDEYTVHAAIGAVTTETARFPIMFVTMETMIDEWCYGLTLNTDDIVEPITPISITGIRFLRGSPNLIEGTYVLTHNRDSGTLTYDGGTAYTIPAGNGRVRTTLIGNSRPSGWILVEIDLGTISQAAGTESQTLHFERRTMDVRDLWPMLRDAKAEMETRLRFILEPEVIVTPDTDSASEVYDRIGEAIRLKRPYRLQGPWGGGTPRASYLNFHLPFQFVHRVERINGYINITRSIEVPSTWYVVSPQQGLVEFVPASGAVLTWQVTGQSILFFAVKQDVPRWWHYRIVAGINPTPSDVIECVARSAGRKMLVRAGQAFRSGLASESVSRDGVTESRSYTSSAIYGPYSAFIEDHTKWLASNVQRVSARHAGLITVA